MSVVGDGGCGEVDAGAEGEEVVALCDVERYSAVYLEAAGEGVDGRVVGHIDVSSARTAASVARAGVCRGEDYACAAQVVGDEVVGGVGLLRAGV